MHPALAALALQSLLHLAAAVTSSLREATLEPASLPLAPGSPLACRGTFGSWPAFRFAFALVLLQEAWLQGWNPPQLLAEGRVGRGRSCSGQRGAGTFEPGAASVWAPLYLPRESCFERDQTALSFVLVLS